MKPYYEAPGITIYHGKSEDVLAALPADHVGGIVTDPPFGQTNESYDSGVTAAVWQECFRVAAANAACVSFTGNPTYHRLACGIENAGWQVRQMWSWFYRDGYMISAYPKEGFDRLVPAMTPICYATKGKHLLRLERVGESWNRTRNTAGYSDRASVSKLNTAKGHWPRSLVTTHEINEFQYFLLSMTHSTRKEMVGHPNQKPVCLMQWITDKLPGPTILDPFMGSGTTLVAARLSGHAAIGIEMNESYCEMAAKRLEAEPAAPVAA